MINAGALSISMLDRLISYGVIEVRLTALEIRELR